MKLLVTMGEKRFLGKIKAAFATQPLSVMSRSVNRRSGKNDPTSRHTGSVVKSAKVGIGPGIGEGHAKACDPER